MAVLCEREEYAGTLAAMERAGKLQCLVTINLHDAPIKAGVKHAICLHGSVYHNRCPRCGRQYGVDYMINSVPCRCARTVMRLSVPASPCSADS